MKSRASSHILILLIIVGLTALGDYSIHYSALIRGYETSSIAAYRDLLLFVPLMLMMIFIARFTRFKGNWTIFTTALLLFSLGMVGQYRLFSDPEYISVGDKAQAREQKIETLQLRYIKENYSPEKKRIMGLPPTNPTPADLATETPRPSDENLFKILVSGRTLIPLFAFLCFFGAYLLCRRDFVLDLLQKNGFIVLLITVIPFVAAAVMSRSGKFLGNITPWELAKVPFLIGFAAILTVLYRNLSQTYWGFPRVKDLVQLIFAALVPFVPFILLKDFGQMLVFSAAFIVLYVIAVKRLPQRVVFVGSVVFVVATLMVSALPTQVQEKIPILPTIAKPINSILPPRIHQRFHLWFDALNPPDVETDWWRNDLVTFYADEYREELIAVNAELKTVYEELATKKRHADCDPMPAPETPMGKLCKTADDQLKILAETDEDRMRGLNEEAWFADDAMQASRATFGISSGGKTGRGLGLGYPELIPVADSDYIYSALGEELGLSGGLLITLALIIFVIAGTRTALDARDMFTKLCSAGLTVFIGFQALVNMGGITRALPMTGITLPFVSHGGFSLITSFAMLGMLLAFSHRNSVDAEDGNFSQANQQNSFKV